MAITRNKLKDIKSLLTKKGRKEKKQFVAEGVRLLEEALRHQFDPEVVFYAPSMVSERARNLVGKFERRGITAVSLKAQQLKPLTDTKVSQGLLGVFAVPGPESSESWPSDSRRVLLCDGISDPGNMGTLIRSALAFGFSPILLTGRCCEPYAPKVVRSSAGAVFGANILTVSPRKVLPLVRDRRLYLVAADPGGTTTVAQLKDVLARKKVLLAIGSEAEGLSGDLHSRSATLVRIEHMPDVESLNAAVAGSILMKTIFDLA